MLCLFVVGGDGLAAAVGHDDAAVRLGAGGERGHVGMILKGGMDDMALIGIHRLERDVPAIADNLARDLDGQPLERLFTLGAIVLSVDVDARALVLPAVDGVVRQVLDGVERFTAAADQNAEIGADQIDQIPIINLLLYIM